MTQYVCDKCGAICNSDRIQKVVLRRGLVFTYLTPNNSNIILEIDLCNFCLQKVVDFIKTPNPKAE